MQHGWRLLIVPIWALSIAGAVVIAALSLGWVGWMPFAVAGAIGLVLGVPAGIWNTRKLRREDPHWHNGHYVAE